MKDRIDMLRRPGPPSLRERRRWARSIEKLVADANRRILQRAYWPLANTTAVHRATPALLDVATALRQQDLLVSRDLLGELRAFLTDGGASPLYGNHPIAALWAAEELRRRFAPVTAPLRHAA
ncbi:MAG TPA: hypothetical protein VF995_07235 [Actinomycetota bacterium]